MQYGTKLNGTEAFKEECGMCIEKHVLANNNKISLQTR